MRSSLLTIGDELLIGQVLDTNAFWLAEKLLMIGAPVQRKMTVGDDVKAIKQAIILMLSESDIVIMTGGIGPTRDDVTKIAITEVLDQELVFNQEMYSRLENIFSRRGISITDAHYKQCCLPEGATLLKNRLGTAPGMLFQIGRTKLISLPGVSYEMKGIMENEVIPRLKQTVKPSYRYLTLHTAGCPESTLAKEIDPVIEQYQPDLKIAYLPSSGEVRLRLSARETKDYSADELIERGKGLLMRTIGSHIYSYNGESLAAVIGKELNSKNLRLSTAESCTGGRVANMITAVAGSSDYFVGGVVAYSNDIKQNLLKVSKDTLIEHGAVSEQVVREMVGGILRLTMSDVGIAISGIAGPGGGSSEKPIGTTWIAVGDKSRMVSRKYIFGNDRTLNIRLASVYALTHLRRFLIEQ
jgi:nicotinamide-nucleotide amidase